MSQPKKDVSALVLVSFVHSEGTSDVITITASNVQLLKDNNYLVEFFTPWCGFCKKLAPIYEELATKVKGKHNIAKVDCTTDQDICQQFQVAGYPTIKYVSQGQVYEYQGAREVEDFEKFLDGGYQSAKKTPFPGGKTGDSSVLELDSVNFAEVNNGQKWFIVFYAPWCGFCKKYMPGFEKVSSQFAGNVRFGKINCDEHKSICELYNIPGYPTFKYFESDGYRDFAVEPSENNIVQYLQSGYSQQQLKSRPWHPIFRMVHAAILEFVYLFLGVAFLLGLALGYAFFAPSAIFPPTADSAQQVNSYAQPHPTKAEKAD
ncbi:thioredoxin fold domain-containing protein [Heterostelium album PN500]|uniref:Thioredoxin fold domain-containing protein n=1 Tax=Heterostelium pallidum (strain ATCC 26659 / Pp 5 / PN500) TaxID=670386 RepID=D3BNF1_HETP5|nr:thioredoxin fold domain-containing protein [Heterostelium album PN500]EFA76811.1 thioredoxin fold domain-containing protein [Heterostelium album PN500]|eukprot:XP_020428943.1 thioredoxin fold domain-containing protein [Heterostelium album PN500]